MLCAAKGFRDMLISEKAVCRKTRKGMAMLASGHRYAARGRTVASGGCITLLKEQSMGNNEQWPSRQ